MILIKTEKARKVFEKENKKSQGATLQIHTKEPLTYSFVYTGLLKYLNSKNVSLHIALFLEEEYGLTENDVRVYKK